MASAIETILDAVAAWNVEVDSNSSSDVGVWNIDEVQENLPPASLPRRVFTVEETPGEMMFVGLCQASKNTWTVTDRLYLAPVGEMKILERYTGRLIRYAVNYMEAARTHGKPTAQSWIEAVQCRPRFDLNFGGTQFLGVDCILTISELVSGA